MSTRIIIKNLPKDITKEKLVAHVLKNCPSSEVTDCNLKFTRDGVFRKFAFVGFNSSDQAVNAQKKLNGTFIRTTKIQVDVAADIGSSNLKAWSKYSLKNQKKSGDKPAAATPPTQQVSEEKEPEKKDGNNQPKPRFILRMKGLSGFYTEKTVQDFFKPIKLKSIRIPRNSQKKPIGVAYVEFGSEKDQTQAMGRNKNYINSKKVFLKPDTEEVMGEKSAKIQPPPWELKSKDSHLKEVENIAESGRLFVRNLWFGVTEEELEEVFKPFGPLAEVVLPVDPLTKKVKGFAHVVFVFPEDALKAYTKLDYTSLHGRLLHILPGRELDNEVDESNEKSSYKKKKDLQSKNQSGHNWNTLFLGANAVADAMALKYKTDKSQILDDQLKGSVGVRLALGETQIISETREFLLENGVVLDSFSQAAGERSKSVILVKNLPSLVTVDDLKEVFSKHGTLHRVLLPSSGITAIVEYLEPSEARQAFMKLNFAKFRSIPLYLEWAPVGVFKTPAPSAPPKDADKSTDGEIKKEAKDEESQEVEKLNVSTNAQNEKNATSKAENSEDEVEEEATLFVKNLNFSTTDDSLKNHFEKFGKIVSATVSRKKDPKRGELLSMGYGFVQFVKKASAKEALKCLQNSVLDDHNLELKLSTRTTQQVKERKKQGETPQTSTKILVRNIPFEANKKEIEELFKVFGELKFVRLPKKLGGTGPHRGFAFVDFVSKQDAKRAFNALCHSTHLYGRRLVLEWAEAEVSLEELRRKTAQHFSNDGPKSKKIKSSLKKDLENL